MSTDFRRPARLCAAGFVLFATAAQAITTERVASGLSYPVFVTAPAGDPRLFIVEQGGVIKILKDGSILPGAFFDIDSLTTDADGTDERGLLGLTFAPDYATSGHFYVYYTDLSSDSVIRRYTVSSDPDVADLASMRPVLFVDQPPVYQNHKGGTIAIGPDRFLYIALGDGGGANDPDGNAQAGDTLLGKMLRLDPTGDAFPGDPNNNYSIPASNPFVGNPSFRDEIWAYGLRNPYRWSFDRLTGDIYIGEVGQACWEEIDFQPAGSAGGENYGWNISEGNHCFEAFGACDPGGCNLAPITVPIHEYDHEQDVFSCAIAGGVVYRGDKIPALRGTYFYADYCSDQIYSLRYDGANMTELTNRTLELDPGGSLSITAIAAICEDALGELYIVDRAPPSGEIYKIVRLHRREALLPDPGSFLVEPSTVDAEGLHLSPAAPNPTEGTTRFDLRVDVAADLVVTVHDAAGRLVRSVFRGQVEAGTRSFEWDGRDGLGLSVAAGVYFVRAEAAGRATTQRITRMR